MKPAGYALVVPLVVAFLAGCPVRSVTPWKGKALLVTKDYLRKGTREKWGYGAYSYVLLPRAPADDERYVALLTAFLKLPSNEPVEPDGQSTPLRARNVTYAPVLAAPTEDAHGVDWLVESYDVARSAAMLHAQELPGRGPYVVTSSVPLSPMRSRTEIAVLDLSSASRGQMQVWMDYFERASKGPNQWAQRGAELALLKLHDLLTGLGMAGQVTVKALEPGGKIMEVLRDI